MARKFEWKECKPFAPESIPGFAVTELEKRDIIAFGININLPDEGACLAIEESIELLKKLKKNGYRHYRIERVNKPTGGYTVAFVGKSDEIHDKGSKAGIIAPLLTFERDGWYWSSSRSNEMEVDK